MTCFIASQNPAHLLVMESILKPGVQNPVLLLDYFLLSLLKRIGIILIHLGLLLLLFLLPLLVNGAWRKF